MHLPRPIRDEHGPGAAPPDGHDEQGTSPGPLCTHCLARLLPTQISSASPFSHSSPLPPRPVHPLRDNFTLPARVQVLVVFGFSHSLSTQENRIGRPFGLPSLTPVSSTSFVPVNNLCRRRTPNPTEGTFLLVTSLSSDCPLPCSFPSVLEATRPRPTSLRLSALRGMPKGKTVAIRGGNLSTGTRLGLPLAPAKPPQEHSSSRARLAFRPPALFHTPGCHLRRE